LPDSDCAQPLPNIDLDVEIASVTDAAEAMASWLPPDDLVDLLLSAERMHFGPLRKQQGSGDPKQVNLAPYPSSIFLLLIE
jgi:hypothetical protein